MNTNKISINRLTSKINRNIDRAKGSQIQFEDLQDAIHLMWESETDPDVKELLNNLYNYCDDTIGEMRKLKYKFRAMKYILDDLHREVEVYESTENQSGGE